jgi:DNA-directed RNA polymerase specialized sigma24 family protein
MFEFTDEVCRGLKKLLVRCDQPLEADLPNELIDWLGVKIRGFCLKRSVTGAAQDELEHRILLAVLKRLPKTIEKMDCSRSDKVGLLYKAISFAFAEEVRRGDDSRRNERLRTRLKSLEFEEQVTHTSDTALIEAYEQVARCLELLPSEQRIVLLLVLTSSNKSAAEELQKSESRTTRIKKDALKALGDCYRRSQAR